MGTGRIGKSHKSYIPYVTCALLISVDFTKFQIPNLGVRCELTWTRKNWWLCMLLASGQHAFFGPMKKRIAVVSSGTVLPAACWAISFFSGSSEVTPDSQIRNLKLYEINGNQKRKSHIRYMIYEILRFFPSPLFLSRKIGTSKA